MSKFSQLLRMVNLLESLKDGEYLKTEELAIELGVSNRMIRKYLTDIKEAGLPLISVSGRLGGHCIRYDITIEYII